MTIAIVRSVVERFLKDPLPSVLVIRGKWGTGKTYFWKSFIADRRNESSRQQYSYVSLFGLPSIKDLQLAAFVNTTHIKDVRFPSGSVTTSNSMTVSLKSLAKKFATKAGPIFPGILGKSVSFAIENMAPHLIRDTLVCLDDFERLPNIGIQFEEVLGFVSSLKEEKNCKAVLIFNDEELQSRADVYRRYREKVIDVEVLFEPSVEEAADLALTADTPCRAIVREKLQALEIRNIRLIRKIVSDIRLVYPVVCEASESTAENAVTMAVLLTWIEYGSDADPPTRDFLRKWNQMAYYAERSDKANRTADAEQGESDAQRIKRWSELLDNCDVMTFTPCDAAVERAISAGFVEGSGLDWEIAKLKDDEDASELEARFVKGWRLYHDSYEDNKAEITAIFKQTFDAAAPKMTPGNVDATVRLLRNFGESELADDLIERFIRIRQSDGQICDPEQWDFEEAVKDVKFRARCAELYAVVKHSPTLVDVLMVFARSKGWSVEQLNVLKAASAGDLYDAFKANSRSDAIVEGCLQFASDSNLKHIAENATTALRRIAGESLINRLRVQSKFGISRDS
jgi:hypothetical protein